MDTVDIGNQSANWLVPLNSTANSIFDGFGVLSWGPISNLDTHSQPQIDPKVEHLDIL
jgi:hypothetical protein